MSIPYRHSGGGLSVQSIEQNVALVEKQKADWLMTAAVHQVGVAAGRPKDRVVCTERIMCENKINPIKGSLEKELDGLGKKHVAISGTFKLAIEKNEEANRPSLRQAEAEVLEAYQAAKTMLEDTLKQTLAKLDEARRPDNTNSLDAIGRSAASLWKGVHKETAWAEWTHIQRVAKKSVSAVAKVERDDEVADDVRAQLPPIALAMAAVSTKQSKVSSSIYEAKLGIRAAKLSFADAEFIRKLAAKPMVRTMKKQLLKSHATASYVVGSLDVPKQRQIHKHLQPKLEASCFAMWPFPKDSAWGAKISAWQLFSVTPSHLHAGVSPFGMTDARLILDGEACFMGAPVDQSDGADSRDKRVRALALSEHALETFIMQAASGWVLKVVAGDFVFIPSGHMVMRRATDEYVTPFGLRWSVAGDAADMLRVQGTMGSVLREYLETKGTATGYGQLVEYLERQHEQVLDGIRVVDDNVGIGHFRAIAEACAGGVSFGHCIGEYPDILES